MGHFGFSYVGFVFMLMLIVPNLIWTKYQPEEYDFKDENKVLLVFERVGQVGVTGAALVFSDFNIHGWSGWSFWLIAAFVLMILYECWWIRYFKSNRTWKDFYNSFYGIPVAGAILPVVAFFFSGNIWESELADRFRHYFRDRSYWYPFAAPQRNAIINPNL